VKGKSPQPPAPAAMLCASDHGQSPWNRGPEWTVLLSAVPSAFVCGRGDRDGELRDTPGHWASTAADLGTLPQSKYERRRKPGGLTVQSLAPSPFFIHSTTQRHRVYKTPRSTLLLFAFAFCRAAA
jgi:hypothetical protein